LPVFPSSRNIFVYEKIFFTIIFVIIFEFVKSYFLCHQINDILGKIGIRGDKREIALWNIEF
jgi:hypothetical protein